MSLLLKAVLDSDVLSQASPLVVAGQERLDATVVRWVHSSEVLEIAALLSGGELLLASGAGLASLRPATLAEYARSLAARRVAAVAIETAHGPSLPRPLVEAADAAGLPLIELRQVVPFVEVAEEINRRIVSERLSTLIAADRLTQSLTERLGGRSGDLGTLVETAAAELGARILVTTLDERPLAEADHRRGTADDAAGDGGTRGAPPSGESPGSSGPGARDEHPSDHSETVSSDLNVGGAPVGRLSIQGDGRHGELHRLLAPRLAGILALALPPAHRPSLHLRAEDALISIVATGGGGETLSELSQAVGLQPESAGALAVVDRGAEGGRAIVQALRAALPEAAVGTDGPHVLLVIPLPSGPGSRGRRQTVLERLRETTTQHGVGGALGPTVASIHEIGRSLAEALAGWRLGRSSKWTETFYDTLDFALERMAERFLTRAKAQEFVDDLLGPVLAHDAAHGTELVRTLDVWLGEGCNTTASAQALFLERQSLHKRLRRIFELLGGDPRGRGSLAGLTVAVKFARGNTQLREK